MPPRDREEQPDYPNLMIVFAAIVGIIIICICISVFASMGSEPEQEPDIITTIPTPVITKVTTAIQTVKPTVASPPIHLNYTFNNLKYRMSVPRDHALENIYENHELTYVCTKYGDDRSPCSLEETQTYYQNYVNDAAEDGVLNDMVNTIQHQTTFMDDQARIAISIVQQIPYDSVKAEHLTNTSTIRYPYQVIYDQKGICSEKSILLAALLKKLGFGVALFHFEEEKHMALGIKVPAQYGYAHSEYAFIEPTSPSIPTDSLGSYTGTGKQLTSTPLIYKISGGISMDSISQEYNDNIRYHQILMMGNELPEEYYYEWQNFTVKYGLIIA